MSDKTPNFRPYINPEMAEYENTQAFRDFVIAFTKPISAEEFDEISNRISEDVDTDFYKKNPVGILESGEIKPDYKARVLNLAQIDQMSDEQFDLEFDEDSSYLSGLYLNRDLDIFTDATEFIVFDELKINYGELEINILDLLPEGYKIILINPDIIDASEVNFKFKYILLDKDINSLGGLLILLHEIGHVINDSSEYEDPIESDINDMSKLEEEDDNEDYFDISLEEPRTFKKHIISERDASLFALKKIWKELRKHPDQKRDAINYLRYFFSTYCVNYLEDSAYNNEVKES